MPERATKKRAAKAKRQGKSPSTQAGEYVREEIHHVREGKHGARSPEQAIAIGLSKARRDGVDLPPPEGPSDTRRQAKRDLARGRKTSKRKSKARSRASKKALGRKSGAAASRKALSRHAKKAASKRTKAERSASARKAARTRKRKR